MDCKEIDFYLDDPCELLHLVLIYHQFLDMFITNRSVIQFQFPGVPLITF